MGKSSKSKEQTSPLKGVLSRVMAVDLFGEAVNFQVEGSSTYQSVCGTVLSVCILAFVIMYGANKASILLNFDDNTFQEIVKRNSNDPNRMYSQEETKLNAMV